MTEREIIDMLKHELAVLETAARRYARGLDNSATYMLACCERARETLDVQLPAAIKAL